MKKYGFEMFWSDEDEGYIVTCPDFPGLSAFGKTHEKALKEARVALELFMEAFEEEGMELPVPTQMLECSGQIRLRMPKTLHARLSKNAGREGVSLNTYLVSLISDKNAECELIFKLEGIIDAMPEKVSVHHHYHGRKAVIYRKEQINTYNPNYEHGEQYENSITVN